MDNSKEIEIPIGADGQASFLLPAELVAYLNMRADEIRNNILNLTYDIEMPRKDIAAIINWQGELAMIKEMLAIHESKLNSEGN